jgi:hypothetical protein
MDKSRVSPVDIIPPLFSMLIYHLGGEQQARWWLQFIVLASSLSTKYLFIFQQSQNFTI